MRLHRMRIAKPTVTQTAGEGTLISGNASGYVNFTGYSPGATTSYRAALS